MQFQNTLRKLKCNIFYSLFLFFLNKYLAQSIKNKLSTYILQWNFECFFTVLTIIFFVGTSFFVTVFISSFENFHTSCETTFDVCEFTFIIGMTLKQIKKLKVVVLQFLLSSSLIIQNFQRKKLNIGKTIFEYDFSIHIY